MNHNLSVANLVYEVNPYQGKCLISPFPLGSSIVPAKGIPVPNKSIWKPSTGTLRPDPTGSGYSIPRRAGTGMPESGRGISPDLMSGNEIRGTQLFFSPPLACPKNTEGNGELSMCCCACYLSAMWQQNQKKLQCVVHQSSCTQACVLTFARHDIESLCYKAQYIDDPVLRTSEITIFFCISGLAFRIILSSW